MGGPAFFKKSMHFAAAWWHRCVSLPHEFATFFTFCECTTRFARFFNLCLSKSNEIRPEQQRQDQATSEELRIVWRSKAKQYRSNLTSLNVSYALRDIFISGSQWTIQRNQENFKAVSPEGFESRPKTSKIHGPKWSPLARAEKDKRIAPGGSFP